MVGYIALELPSVYALVNALIASIAA
jgi:hypothetical protein